MLLHGSVQLCDHQLPVTFTNSLGWLWLHNFKPFVSFSCHISYCFMFIWFQHVLLRCRNTSPVCKGADYQQSYVFTFYFKNSKLVFKSVVWYFLMYFAGFLYCSYNCKKKLFGMILFFNVVFCSVFDCRVTFIAFLSTKVQLCLVQVRSERLHWQLW